MSEVNEIVSIARRGAVAVLTINRPPVNALGEALIAALHSAMDRLEDDSGVALMHIRAVGKVFCGGADLAEMKRNLADPTKVDAQIAFVRDLQKVLKRIEDFPVTTLVEISGAAMGGGLELALACDLRIAANEAKLALPEVNLGLIPGAGGTQRLTELCGAAIAKRLILGAEILDGAKAAALGVVHWAVPRVDLIAFGDATADRLAALPRGAVAAAKSCIAAFTDETRDGYEEELTKTRDLLLHESETRRRVEAFLSGAR
jgi:enoyl-CoA hydratase/carnithine racemase